jgi:hypothetical protein
MRDFFLNGIQPFQVRRQCLDFRTIEIDIPAAKEDAESNISAIAFE